MDFSTSFDESNLLDNDDEKTFSNKSDDDIEEIFAESLKVVADASHSSDAKY